MNNRFYVYGRQEHAAGAPPTSLGELVSHKLEADLCRLAGASCLGGQIDGATYFAASVRHTAHDPESGIERTTAALLVEASVPYEPSPEGAQRILFGGRCILNLAARPGLGNASLITDVFVEGMRSDSDLLALTIGRLHDQIGLGMIAMDGRDSRAIRRDLGITAAVANGTIIEVHPHEQ